MRKISLFFSAFLMLSVGAYAGDKGNVKITWGQEFALPKKHYELGFLGDSKKGYVELSHQHGKSIAIQKFTPSLKLTGQTDISTSNLPKGYMIESIWDMGGKDYVFYSTWSKKEKVEKLYAQSLNVGAGKFEGDAKELLGSTDKLSGTLTMTGSFQYNTADKWKLVRSADSSKLMIYYRIKPKEKKDAINKDVIGMFVYDQNLNSLWGKRFEMPYTEKMMDNDDYQVDSKGNVYILAKVYNSEGKKKDVKDYHYEVLMYSKGSDKPIVSKFNFADKYVVDISLSEDRTGRMICAGYYSKSGEGTDGAFFLSFDEASKSMKNIKKGFYEFPADVMREFESKKAKKKSEKKENKGEDEEVSHLVYRNLEVGDDGSLTLFGEQYSWTMYVSYNGKTTTTTYRYFFDDIYAMRISADGEMQWVKKIPKAQRGSTQNVYAPNRLGLSYHLHTVGNDSYLFFVDNMKNLNITPGTAPAVHVAGAGGILMSVKISGDGTVSKSNLFDFREEKMNVMVRDFSDVNTNEIIGRARKLKGPFQMNFQNGKPLLITVN